MSSSDPGDMVDDSFQSQAMDSSTDDNVETGNVAECLEEITLETDGLDSEEHQIVIEQQGEAMEEEVLFEDEKEVEPQQIEIHTENQENRTEQVVERKYKTTTSMPPLRLLNIAPKPEQVPISVKPISGQQVILVPGTSGNQAIKLINQQGQEINLAKYSLSRPITIKQEPNMLQQVQPKQLFVKKVMTGGVPKTIAKPINISKLGQQQLVVLHKTGEPSAQQPIKLLQSATTTTSPTAVQGKTITLQQAQEMGLLGNAKIVQGGMHTALSGKRTIVINNSNKTTTGTATPMQPKTIKLVSATGGVLGSGQATPTTNIKTITLSQAKSPTKILPAAAATVAANVTSAKLPQRIILKSSTGNQVIPAGQLIQVAAGGQSIAGGQIHQINVPGKGVQYIKFVTTSSANPSSSAVTIVNSVKSTTSSPVVKTEPKAIVANKVTKIAAASGTKPTQVMIVPAGYMPPTVQQIQKVTLPATLKQIPSPVKQISTVVSPRSQSSAGNASSPEPPSAAAPTNATSTTASDSSSNGIRPRKPCNCTKSQCLKLYCDCFANGEFCYLCNCMNCYNNLENEDTRNLAIKACLERNPNAFRPKIGKAKDTTGDVLRKHTKGCNCKRSGCLKNYCECYEAKIACSSNCKCIGCRNVEDSMEKKSLEMHSSSRRISEEEFSQTIYRKILPYYKDADSPPLGLGNRGKKAVSKKQPIAYLTDEVIEATCQCLLTISDEADSNMQDEEATMRQIIEEFGGCLNEIIHCSINGS